MEHKPLPPTPPTEPNNPSSSMTTHNPPTNGGPTPESSQKHIWVITGPAGCGKTSVAEHLHQTFSLPYLEGDTYHTPDNVSKMAAGHPLTDTDRWDWLITLRTACLSTLKTSPGVILTCSALKRKYRDVLRIASYGHPDVKVHFVFLKASEVVLMERVRGRKDHYMKDYMVKSQVESLESPGSDETDVLPVDAGGEAEVVKWLAEGVVKKVMDRSA
nr:hypothetical protein B0A51_09633 [Rachicladosporium sp. CCFEE 5018]